MKDRPYKLNNVLNLYLQHLTKTMVFFIDGYKSLLSLLAGQKHIAISKMGSGNKHPGAPEPSPCIAKTAHLPNSRIRKLQAANKVPGVVVMESISVLPISHGIKLAT